MLCWLARVAFYPQAILYAMATFKQDKKILDYSLALSIFGLFVVLYNYYLEFGGSAIIPCSATGPSCEARYVFEYGFITIPFMGIVGFTSLILAILVAKKANKAKV